MIKFTEVMEDVISDLDISIDNNRTITIMGKIIILVRIGRKIMLKRRNKITIRSCKKER